MSDKVIKFGVDLAEPYLYFAVYAKQKQNKYIKQILYQLSTQAYTEIDIEYSRKVTLPDDCVFSVDTSFNTMYYFYRELSLEEFKDVLERIRTLPATAVDALINQKIHVPKDIPFKDFVESLKLSIL